MSWLLTGNALAGTTNGFYNAVCVCGPDTEGWDDVEQLKFATVGSVHWLSPASRVRGGVLRCPPGRPTTGRNPIARAPSDRGWVKVDATGHWARLTRPPARGIGWSPPRRHRRVRRLVAGEHSRTRSPGRHRRPDPLRPVRHCVSPAPTRSFSSRSATHGAPWNWKVGSPQRHRPDPTSSAEGDGESRCYRLNRGGTRWANAISHRLAVTQLRCDARAKATYENSRAPVTRRNKLCGC